MLVHMGYPSHYHQLPVTTGQKNVKAPFEPKSQPAQSQPVDPHELARRLSLVLAEQRARSERKRGARTEAALGLKQHALNGRPDHDDDQMVPSGAGWTRTESGITHKKEQSSSNDEETSLDAIELKEPSTSTQDGPDELRRKPMYRHVPREAASQFASTTTTELTSDKSPIYALSRQALRFQLDGAYAGQSARANEPHAPSCGKNKVLRRAQSMRERHYQRIHAEKPSLPETCELDTTLYSLGPYHTRQSPSKSGMNADNESGDTRRMSTGGILGRSEPHSVQPFALAATFLSPENREMIGNASNHRVDWTQSDESTTANAVVEPVSILPQLRKKESKWKLRGRLGSFARHGKEDKLLTPPEELVALDAASTKSPITGFRLQSYTTWILISV